MENVAFNEIPNLDQFGLLHNHPVYQLSVELDMNVIELLGRCSDHTKDIKACGKTIDLGHSTVFQSLYQGFRHIRAGHESTILGACSMLNHHFSSYFSSGSAELAGHVLKSSIKRLCIN